MHDITRKRICALLGKKKKKKCEWTESGCVSRFFGHAHLFKTFDQNSFITFE